MMVETTAARLSLRQQKSTAANRPSIGQPTTTNPGSVYPLLVIRLHSSIKQAGNQYNLILRLLLEKPCYNHYDRIRFSQATQNSAFDMPDALAKRDTEKLSESGAYLDKACHANYWYREGL